MLRKTPGSQQTPHGELGLCVGNLPGQAVIVPQAVSEKLGFWNEEYGLYGGEDGDYGLRMLKRRAAIRSIGHADDHLLQFGFGAGLGVVIHVARHGNGLHGHQQLLRVYILRKTDCKRCAIAPLRAHGFIQHFAQFNSRAFAHAQHADARCGPICCLVQRQAFAFFGHEMARFDCLKQHGLHACFFGFGCFG